jgi:hypothetical protein
MPYLPRGIGQTPPPPTLTGPSPTTALYVEIGAAVAIALIAPGYWKVLAALPLVLALGGSAAL